jgi:hypothetical protein
VSEVGGGGRSLSPNCGRTAERVTNCGRLRTNCGASDELQRKRQNKLKESYINRPSGLGEGLEGK